MKSRGSATVATIRIESLLHNLSVFQQAAPDINIMAVVKADAYGHGSVRISRALVEAGVSFLAVATVAEAVELRRHDITERILVLGVPRRASIDAYSKFGLEATVTSLDVLNTLEKLDSASRVDVHLNLDTGMGRVGLQPSELPMALEKLGSMRQIDVVGVATHFSTASRPGAEFSTRQWGLFCEALKQFGSIPPEVHAASSSAVFTIPESINSSVVNVARVGIGLYGLLNLPPEIMPVPLRPVMTLTSEVSHIKTVAPGTPISYGPTFRAARETRIATVAAGYADGVPSHLSNRGAVHINGIRFPIVGAVCMDMFMVDLGPQTESSLKIEPGDIVTLFGEHGPSVVDVASTAGTIAYEIVCRIGRRVPRFYLV